MKRSLITPVVALALAFAGAVQAEDIANVRIVDNGNEHQIAIDLDALKVGERRQLATASGLPAIVSRSEHGLSIEVAGQTTDIALHENGKVMVFGGDHVDPGAHAAAFKVIQFDGATDGVVDGDAQRKIVVMRRHASHDFDGASLDDARLAELLAEVEAKAGIQLDLDTLDGKRVIITRHIASGDDAHD